MSVPKEPFDLFLTSNIHANPPRVLTEAMMRAVFDAMPALERNLTSELRRAYPGPIEAYLDLPDPEKGRR